jgi:UDP-N-acetylmuramate-alanine ligase
MMESWIVSETPEYDSEFITTAARENVITFIHRENVTFYMWTDIKIGHQNPTTQP